MALITTGRLRREFGLSFTAASALVNEQRAVASRRLRVLLWGMIVCNVVVLASYVLVPHWPVWVVPAILLIALLLGALHLYLTHHDSREPILAAARAWRDNSAKPHE
ncbi:MAG: hypothetical protein ABI389_10715 [Rhodanobacter sp.]